MTDPRDLPHDAARRLRWPLRLTHLGMVSERAVRAFWPLWTIVIAALAVLMLGLHESLPLEVFWALAVVSVLGGLWAFARGVRAFRWPGENEALERLDQTIPGRPITAIADAQAIGAGDAASEAVWRAHIRRMTERAREARAPAPDLKLSTRDPYALRYIALLAFVVAVLFGSVWRVASVTEMAPGSGSEIASGPSWEGWIEPPLYTGMPSLYLNDIDQAALEIPAGSRVTIRFYGEVGALTLNETVSGRVEDIPPATDPVQAFDVSEDGVIGIDGPSGREWTVSVIEDTAPEIEFDGPIAAGQRGRMEAPFLARDDYGVTAGSMEITLDLTEIDRRYGLTVDPEPREAIRLDLPMPITGDRVDFAEMAIDDFSEHPWANLAVSATLMAEDAAGQAGLSAPQFASLPGRRFFDPLAQAIIEQRRDLLWNRANAPRVAQVLRAVSHRPESVFRSETVYLKLRFLVRRMETRISLERLDDGIVQEFADTLWGLALEIEEGDLGDALERLQRAQDRLSEAIQNGATDEEIAELMQELREAMQDYMRQLAEQQGDQDGQQLSQNQEMQELSGEQLQDMLDRLQELMEQGRMAEAQQLLEQLRQMMENMQIAEGQQGQSPGEQAMEGLAETLREQQGLSDEAFRELQEQFNPNAQAGQSQQNEGRSGDQGRGQQHGQQGQGQGGNQPGDQQGGQSPGGLEGSLADRQQALRNELERQRQGLPGAGTPEGDAARDSLGRAGEAMDDAEDALREDDFAGALDSQSEAMEALREGMRELAEQMAEQQQQQGQQGQQTGRNSADGNRDPLGREAGQNGRIGTDERLLQGEDVYRRARELLDEIRRRSGDQDRPTEELDYLKRLLDRF